MQSLVSMTEVIFQSLDDYLDQMYEDFSDLELLSPEMIFFILDKIGSVTDIYASKFYSDKSDFVKVNALSDGNIELWVLYEGEDPIDH